MSGWRDLQLISRLGIALTIPAVLAAGPLVGYFAGAWLDRWWLTSPWAMAGGVLLGGIGSCVEVYRILRWIARFERNRTGKA